MDEIHTRLEQWLKGIRIENIANYRAAAYYNQRSRALGLAVTVLSVAAGTTLFTSLASSASVWILAITGLISALAAVLAGAQTFLNYAQLAEKSHTTAINYGVLRHKLEEALASATGSNELKTAMDDIRKQWDQLATDAPTIPEQIYAEAEQSVDSSQHMKYFQT